VLNSRVTSVVLAGALVAVLAGGAGFWYLFFRDAGPPPASLPSSAPPGTAGVTSPATSSPPLATLDGTWNVDDSGSHVGYRVKEELAGIGANTAVGRTSAVTGSSRVGP
jgi:hypothetical protein